MALEEGGKKIDVYRGWIIGHHGRTGWFVERYGVRINTNSLEHSRRRIDERGIEYPVRSRQPERGVVVAEYQGWTNSRTALAALYLEQERVAYEVFSAIRKRGELVTALQVRAEFHRLKLHCDDWTTGPVNWHEIADNYNAMDF